jgi:hypothetical protein
MMKWILLGVILLTTLSGSFAHEDVTGDPAHDLNETHLNESTDEYYASTAQYTAQKEVASWENAWPFVLILFLGLGGFAFAM